AALGILARTGSIAGVVDVLGFAVMGGVVDVVGGVVAAMVEGGAVPVGPGSLPPPVQALSRRADASAAAVASLVVRRSLIGSPEGRAVPATQQNRRSLRTILPDGALIRCILSTGRSLR
ncbi:MAG: hypothetical protein ABI112_14910, partial [Terracoccus sp.]